MALLNFDASQIDPKQSEGGICLPLADYPLEITKILQTAVKDNPSKGYLEIHLKVLDGQYVNQIQVDRLNMYGQAETPTRIAYQRLSAYCHIAGKLRVADSQELIGTKLIGTVGPQDPPNDKYSEVKVVKDIAGNLPVHGQPSAAQPQAGQSFGQQQPAQTQQPAFGAATTTTTTTQQPTWNNPAQTQQPATQTAPWGSGANTGAVAGGGQPPWAK